MKRILSFAVALLLVAGTAFGWPLARVWKGGPPWWYSGLTFYAPFDNPADPLRLIKGTGSLSFTRATTATYTAIDNGYLSTAASGQLRIESNGALIEGQRTNLYTNSADLAAWGTEARSWIDNNVATAPDGTLTADKLVEDATASNTHSTTGGFVALVSDAARSYSVYLKSAGRTRAVVRVYSDNGASGGEFDVNLTTGAVTTASYNGGTANAGTMTNFGGGWWRLNATATPSTTGNTFTANNILLHNGTSVVYSGDNTSGIYIVGHQIEAGSFPSSYIPTVAAAVTRNTDKLTFSSSGNVSDTIGTISGTIDTKSDAFAVYAYDSGNNIGKVSRDKDNDRMQLRDGTSILSLATNGWLINTTIRFAVSYGGSTMSGVINGGTVSSGNFDGSMNGTATFVVGSPYNYSEEYVINGHIKNLRIWNRATDDNSLILLTQ